MVKEQASHGKGGEGVMCMSCPHVEELQAHILLTARGTSVTLGKSFAGTHECGLLWVKALYSITIC